MGGTQPIAPERLASFQNMLTQLGYPADPSDERRYVSPDEASFEDALAQYNEYRLAMHIQTAGWNEPFQETSSVWFAENFNGTIGPDAGRAIYNTISEEYDEWVAEPFDENGLGSQELREMQGILYFMQPDFVTENVDPENETAIGSADFAHQQFNNWRRSRGEAEIEKGDFISHFSFYLEDTRVAMEQYADNNPEKQDEYIALGEQRNSALNGFQQAGMGPLMSAYGLERSTNIIGSASVSREVPALNKEQTDELRDGLRELSETGRYPMLKAVVERADAAGEEFDVVTAVHRFTRSRGVGASDIDPNGLNADSFEESNYNEIMALVNEHRGQPSAAVSSPQVTSADVVDGTGGGQLSAYANQQAVGIPAGEPAQQPTSQPSVPAPQAQPAEKLEI